MYSAVSYFSAQRLSEFLTILISISLGVFAHGQTKRDVTLEDLETLKQVECVKFSPDGATLAYIVDGVVWLVQSKIGSSPHRIGKGMSLSWSPDSKSLAYASNQSGALQLWVFNTISGRPDQLTSFPGGIDPNSWVYHLPNTSEPISQSWSPDSSKLVFNSQLTVAEPTQIEANGPGAPPTEAGTPLVLTSQTPPAWTLSGIFAHSDVNPEWATWMKSSRSGGIPSLPPTKISQLFVVDIRTKTVEQLTKDRGMYFNPDWSPDGRKIACASTDGQVLTGEANVPVNIYIIDVATGKKASLTAGAGDRWLPRWSADGSWIAYWHGPQSWGKHSLAVSRIDGTESFNVMSHLDRFVYGYEWEPDSRSIAVNYVNGVSWSIASVEVRTGHITQIADDKAAMKMYLTVSHSGWLAWQQGDGLSQGIIRVLPLGARDSYPLVDLNPQIHHWQLGEQEVVRWINSRGDTREGILIRPVGYQQGHKYPLIVDGYPQQGNGFKGWAMSGNQAWASRGYAVFYPNPRCPHFWAAFTAAEDQEAAKGPKGWDVAVDDVMSGVDELIHRGIVDPDRMGLYGFSNGGGVVNYLVTRTRRFKCAVSVAGVYPDWERPVFLDTDSAVVFSAGGITPWGSPDDYVQLSAVYHLDKVTTPMLLADGDEDVHDMLLGVIEMYNGLRWLRQNVTLLRYPRQGHGFTGAALKDFWGRENAFFDKYLKPEQPPN